MSNKSLVRAVAYLRTSSAASAGPDKDSDKRQRSAIGACARAAGFTMVGEFYDRAVAGADPITDRPGFSEMLAALLASGATTIIVESPDRFALDLLVQLTGHDLLKARGITLIAATAPTHFTEDTPTARVIRQILGAVDEFEKAALVSKLAAARRRKRGKKVEGRKSLARRDHKAVAPAKRLARHPVNGRKRSPDRGQA